MRYRRFVGTNVDRASPGSASREAKQSQAPAVPPLSPIPLLSQSHLEHPRPWAPPTPSISDTLTHPLSPLAELGCCPVGTSRYFSALLIKSLVIRTRPRCPSGRGLSQEPPYAPMRGPHRPLGPEHRCLPGLLHHFPSLPLFIPLKCRMDAMVLPLYVTSQASASCQFPSLNLSCRVLWTKTIQDYPLPRPRGVTVSRPSPGPLQVSLLRSFLSSLEHLCKPVSSFLNLQPVPLFRTIPPAPSTDSLPAVSP